MEGRGLLTAPALVSCILFAVVKCDHGGRARPSPALVRNERPRKALGSSRPPSEKGGSPNSCLGLRENEEPASARMGPRPRRREPEQCVLLLRRFTREWMSPRGGWRC